MIRIIKLVISIFYYGILQIKMIFARLIGGRRHGLCLVLYYHSVKPEERSRFARQMDDLVKWAKPVRADLREPPENGSRHVAVTFDDGFQSVVDIALPELVKREIPFTIFIPTGHLGRRPRWGIGEGFQDEGERIVTADQLKNLPPDVVTIGSHTVTHPRLARLSEKEAFAELHNSREELESMLGRNVELFSFPHGEYNKALVQLAGQAGYKRVFSITPVPALRERREFVTGRVWASPREWRLEFRLKLLGAYCWLPLAFALKRNIKSIRHKYLRSFGGRLHRMP
jgi:peptidoglycan/xylan/chitin deacetylase (PgdA/CDA1 family)